jgi:hypothetical protein
MHAFHKTFIAVLLMLLLFITADAQDNPVAYMEQFSQKEEELSKNYLSYMSEVAHGSKARKMEKRRVELINSIKTSIRDVARIKPYKGDIALRDSFKEYWSVLLSVITEDYKKIVDMEEIAERSYDAMEVYLLTQEKAEEKLKEAYQKVPVAYNAFAQNNNVRLSEGQSKLNKKLIQLSEVNRYVTQIYLIYFKSSVQETLLLEALAAKDVNAIEQGRNSVLKYASEGLEKLDTVKLYKNDGSLVSACRKVLESQRTNAEKTIPHFTDFTIATQEFEKTQKTFNSKPAAKRTQADVNNYNKSVNDHNKSVNDYNKLSKSFNDNRNKVYANWDTTKKRFMDTHVPYKM